MYNKFYQKLLLLLHFLFCFFYTYRTAAKETGMCALLEGEKRLHLTMHSCSDFELSHYNLVRQQG